MSLAHTTSFFWLEKIQVVKAWKVELLGWNLGFLVKDGSFLWNLLGNTFVGKMQENVVL